MSRTVAGPPARADGPDDARELLVGERLLRDERGSAATARALRVVAGDRRFVRAVATDDPAALRPGIVRFFREPALHVVRMRAVTANGRLVDDVLGPYVLAPASATLRSRGRAIGRVTLSIQDDTGYIKLMRRFADADALPGRPPGRCSAAPSRRARPSSRGSVTYRRTYLVFAFPARAFPSGRLRISLLVPAATG
jgi:hypothetical protein